MRVVLSTYGSRGDVEPMAALAVRLRERGAEVRVCAPPDEEFAKRLAGVGVELVPAGPSVRDMVTGVRPPAGSIQERAARLTAGYFEAVSAAADGADAVVATGLFPTVAGARSAAEKLGVHFAYVALQPTMLPSPHHRPYTYPGHPFPEDVTDNRVLWELHVGVMNEVFGGVVNEHRATVGLPRVDDVRTHVNTDRPWLATDPVLGPWERPAGVDPVQSGAWILPDDRPLPADLVAFLEAGEAPVYVGFGSMPMGQSKETIAEDVVDAVRAQGRRIVVARGWADLAPIDGADDCFVVGEVNQQALFPRVAAVVHHGGAGTTTAAARAGTPQVLVPQVVDQPYWAARVAALGIGVAHDGPVPTAASLSAALGTALGPELRARAAAVAGTVRADGAAVAAEHLVELVGAGRRPV
ncbi:glycosyltransferase [Kitasatospora sp. NPDC059408]|uniref:glycosyltransferase n=1 Tax=Kitasatospora sp. NPDC059408 TaxID=3346823 RepID=UPI0036AA2FB7